MRNIFLLCMAFALFTACKNNEEQSEEAISPIDHDQAVHPGNVGDLDDIELNQGELWKVAPEVSEGIRGIAEIIENRHPETVEDYRALADELDQERSRIENQRESNQIYDSNLDNYLRLLEQKIGELEEIDSEEKGALIVTELEKHLQDYSSYFQ